MIVYVTVLSFHTIVSNDTVMFCRFTVRERFIENITSGYSMLTGGDYAWCRPVWDLNL